MEKIEFNPEIELDRSEQSALASVVSQPGFLVIQKIGKSCVDGFVRDWINKEKEEDVIRSHRHAKVAAQLYTMIIDRIKQEVFTYVNTQPSDKPIDVAESLDIGEYTIKQYKTTETMDEEPFF